MRQYETVTKLSLWSLRPFLFAVGGCVGTKHQKSPADLTRNAEYSSGRFIYYAAAVYSVSVCGRIHSKGLSLTRQLTDEPTETHGM